MLCLLQFSFAPVKGLLFFHRAQSGQQRLTRGPLPLDSPTSGLNQVAHCARVFGLFQGTNLDTPLSRRQPKVEEEEAFPVGQELLLQVPPAPQLQAGRFE